MKFERASLLGRDHSKSFFAGSTRFFCLCVIAAMLMSVPLSLRAAVFDYSPPLTNISVNPAGNTVSFQVFDPAQAALKVSSITAPSPTLISSNNGVVAFTSMSTIYYSVYDPARTNWITGSTNSGATFDLKSGNGIVAWSSGNSVHYRVYDPTRGGWRPGSIVMSASAGADLQSTNGVVAWSSGSTMYFVAYDPALGVWKPASAANSGVVSDMQNRGGVVAWSSSSIIKARTYDPNIASWVPKDVNSGPTFDLKNGNGVVAWSSSATVNFEVYDPTRTNWMVGSLGAGNTSDLSVNNGTVNWLTSSQSYTRGYSNGVWYPGVTLPLAAFFISANYSNPPLTVFFVDMSIGASAWSWSFGDGGSSNLRSPVYTYRGFNRYNVTLTASGIGGANSTTRQIVSDITPPSGTIQINGTNSLVTSNQVLLTLSATDNSGVVTAMRFRNDNTNGAFSEWEPYATNKVWLLSTNDGIKTVYVQFSDIVSNVSASVGDNITMDTTPPSLVYFSFSNTNLSENIGSYPVRVLLDRGFPRGVSVDYITSDGTANAGSDYTSVTGRLIFPPNETLQVINLPIRDDALVELNETFLITLFNPTNAVVGPSATITIMDNDPPAMSFSQSSYTVGEGDGGAIITVSLSPASGQTVSVNYAVSNGTATAGADYSAVGGTLVFAPGQLSRSFTVPILNDITDETNETVLLHLQSPTNAVLGAIKNSVLTIMDDDPPTVRFSTNLYAVSEGSGSVLVTVTLSKPFSQTVFVDISTGGGSAQPGSDYVSSSSTLTFAPQQTSKNFQISLLNDTAYETNKTFGVSLSNFFNCTPGLVNANVLIQDDDATRVAAVSTNGNVHLVITGPPGQRCSIEASSGMSNWSSVAVITNFTGSTVYEAGAPSAGSRFYRAAVLP